MHSAKAARRPDLLVVPLQRETMGWPFSARVATADDRALRRQRCVCEDCLRHLAVASQAAFVRRARERLPVRIVQEARRRAIGCSGDRVCGMERAVEIARFCTRRVHKHLTREGNPWQVVDRLRIRVKQVV